MTRPVGNSQRVASNLRQADPAKPLSVFWEQTAAYNGTTVRITGVVNGPVHSPVQPTVWILFNGVQHQPAKNVKVVNGQITAEWTVTPKNHGDFTSGEYHVEIKYAGLVGKTGTSLRIVRPGGNPNVSTFGR
jgi:hypothetical protein